MEDILDEESEAERSNLDSCAGKMCTANEHCCDKHVCVDADESTYEPKPYRYRNLISIMHVFNYFPLYVLATGTCLPIWGKKQGEHCYNDQDCESGFLCMGAGAKRTCQTPTPGDKLLGKLQPILDFYIMLYVI